MHDQNKSLTRETCDYVTEHIGHFSPASRCGIIISKKMKMRSEIFFKSDGNFSQFSSTGRCANYHRSTIGYYDYTKVRWNWRVERTVLSHHDMKNLTKAQHDAACKHSGLVNIYFGLFVLRVHHGESSETYR